MQQDLWIIMVIMAKATISQDKVSGVHGLHLNVEWDLIMINVLHSCVNTMFSYSDHIVFDIHTQFSMKIPSARWVPKTHASEDWMQI
jgi:hypothetical protein